MGSLVFLTDENIFYLTIFLVRAVCEVVAKSSFKVLSRVLFCLFLLLVSLRLIPAADPLTVEFA